MATRNKFEFNAKYANVLKALKDAMIVIATDSENHFKRSFRTQGFENETVEKWDKRKTDKNLYKKNQGRNRRRNAQSDLENFRAGYAVSSSLRLTATGKSNLGRAILIQSGDLRRLILRTRLNAYRYKIESDLPYSAIHNYGLQGMAFGKHPFKMPQRRFMGVSKKLRRKNVLTLKRFINNAMT